MTRKTRVGGYMRKILFSANYGAGWVSWHSGSPEEKRFMLEYAPFVEFLEKGGKFTEKGSELHDADWLQPKELVDQFKADWDKNFPKKAGDYPYLGGLRDLAVYEVADGTVVRVEEYDGYESVVTSYDDWL